MQSVNFIHSPVCLTFLPRKDYLFGLRKKTDKRDGTKNARNHYEQYIKRKLSANHFNKRGRYANSSDVDDSYE